MLVDNYPIPFRKSRPEMQVMELIVQVTECEYNCLVLLVTALIHSDSERVALNVTVDKAFLYRDLTVSDDCVFLSQNSFL